MQTCFVRVKQCDVTCLWVWVPEEVFGFGWKWLRTATKISRDGPQQISWSKGEKTRRKSNKQTPCLFNAICTTVTVIQMSVPTEHCSHARLCWLYFLMGSEHTRKRRFCLLARMRGSSYWLNHWAGFGCWGCFSVFWMWGFLELFLVFLCEEWKLFLAFHMTFSIFSQTAVDKCPFPKELPFCRPVIVIVTQPGIDRNLLYKKSKKMIFNKRFILHGKNLNYCLISRQTTYFAL